MIQTTKNSFFRNKTRLILGAIFLFTALMGAASKESHLLFLIFINASLFIFLLIHLYRQDRIELTEHEEKMRILKAKLTGNNK